MSNSFEPTESTTSPGAHLSPSEFEQVKEASVSQLLIKAGRLVNERGVSRIPPIAGQPRLRPSHTSVLPHLDFEGTRMSVLAERLGVSKQAVSQLIGDMEQMGLVRRIADPSDGRARLVVFAEHGPTLLMRGMRFLQEVDDELSEQLGDAQMQSLRGALLKIVERLSTD